MAKKNILIVDDTGYNRIVLSRFLTPEGYLVEEAANGEEALQLLSRNRFNLMITDLMMPHMDGLELFEKAHNAEFSDKEGKILCPPCILCTAITDERVLNEAIKAGFVDVITRPVERERLLKTVKETVTAGVETVHMNLAGTHAIMLTTLAEMVGASPQEVTGVILEQLSASEIDDSINSLEALGEYLKKSFTTVE